MEWTPRTRRSRHAFRGTPTHCTRISSASRPFVKRCGSLDVHQEDPGWWLRHAPEAVRRVWPLLREGRASVGEVLGELFGADEAVKVALAANLSYYHDDPDRMSFLSYAIPQASYLDGRRPLCARGIGSID